MSSIAVTGLEGNLICALTGFLIVTELPRLVLIYLTLILCEEPVGGVSYGISALIGIGYRASQSVCALAKVVRISCSIDPAGNGVIDPARNIVLSVVTESIVIHISVLTARAGALVEVSGTKCRSVLRRLNVVSLYLKFLVRRVVVAVAVVTVTAGMSDSNALFTGCCAGLKLTGYNVIVLSAGGYVGDVSHELCANAYDNVMIVDSLTGSIVSYRSVIILISETAGVTGVSVNLVEYTVLVIVVIGCITTVEAMTYA